MKAFDLIKPLHFSLLTFFTLTVSISWAQKVDSIYFNLYTDSLKKGTHNYINVDGKLSNGRWLPLTTKEINFSTTAGKFEGNSLYIEPGFEGEKMTITATLKENPSISKSLVVYVKKKDTGAPLKTPEQMQKEWEDQNPKKKKKKTN
jgi:hypothetical protein